MEVIFISLVVATIAGLLALKVKSPISKLNSNLEELSGGKPLNSSYIPELKKSDKSKKDEEDQEDYMEWYYTTGQHKK